MIPPDETVVEDQPKVKKLKPASKCKKCKKLPMGEFFEGHEHSEPVGEIQESFLEETMPVNLRDKRFSAFKIKKIIVQNGHRELHLEIMKTFEKFYMDYHVELTCDLADIDWRIEEKKKAKANYEAANQMDAFEEMKQRELEEFDRGIEILVESRAEKIARSPKVSFEASVIDFAKKVDSTDLVFIIPTDTVGPLNDVYNIQDNYMIELIKNLSND